MMNAQVSDQASVRFSATRRAMHWLTVLLLVGSFALVWAVDWLPPGQSRAQIVGLHRTIGLLVL